jgi:hypothetical protein
MITAGPDYPTVAQIGAANPLPVPVATIPGREPIAIHAQSDPINGVGEVEFVYAEKDIGPFRFDQSNIPHGPPLSSEPATCIGCNEDESGWVTLATGDRALIWVDGAGDQVLNSIVWQRRTVRYWLYGPPTTFTREVMITLANAAAASHG